jgi:hypothetical protein
VLRAGASWALLCVVGGHNFTPEIAQSQFEAAEVGVVVVADGEGNTDGVSG